MISVRNLPRKAGVHVGASTIAAPSEETDFIASVVANAKALDAMLPSRIKLLGAVYAVDFLTAKKTGDTFWTANNNAMSQARNLWLTFAQPVFVPLAGDHPESANYVAGTYFNRLLSHQEDWLGITPPSDIGGWVAKTNAFKNELEDFRTKFTSLDAIAPGASKPVYASLVDTGPSATTSVNTASSPNSNVGYLIAGGVGALALIVFLVGRN